MDKPSFIIVGYGRMGKLVKEVLDGRSEIIGAIVKPNMRVTEPHIDLYHSIKDFPFIYDSAKHMAICFTTSEA